MKVKILILVILLLASQAIVAAPCKNPTGRYYLVYLMLSPKTQFMVMRFTTSVIKSVEGSKGKAVYYSTLYGELTVNKPQNEYPRVYATPDTVDDMLGHWVFYRYVSISTFFKNRTSKDCFYVEIWRQVKAGYPHIFKWYGNTGKKLLQEKIRNFMKGKKKRKKK